MKSLCSSKNLTEGGKRQAVGQEESFPQKEDGLIPGYIRNPAMGKVDGEADADVIRHW